MKRDLKRLADERFDLCILGGGINGLATARDAAQRGLTVALVEQGDFGGETSAGSLKILHGGLRYLQHLDFSRMTESIRERNALTRMAPHLVDPLGFLVPTHPGLMTGKPAMRAALTANDIISWRRNKGVRDREQILPGGRILSRREVKSLTPCLPKDSYNGGAVFYDAQMRNSDRYTLSFALAAAADGAALANRVNGIRFQVKDGRIEALECEDRESGDGFELRARQFAVMTGPWRDLLPGLISEKPADEEVVKNAGVQLVTKRGPCDTYGLALPGGDVDPDAKLQRGGRHYFSTPWQGHTLWGTLDKEYRGRPQDWRIQEADIQEFIEEINHCLPGYGLKREEVTFAFGGLRMTDADAEGAGSRVSRRYAIRSHRKDLGLKNLISMDGIKYTACRVMAEKAVDKIALKLDRNTPGCRTAETLLPGAEYETRSTLEAEIRVAVPREWPDETVSWLADNYGSDWPHLWQENGEQGLLPDGITPVRAVDLAVESEMALHLEDMILRRLPLGTLAEPSAELLHAVADRMATALGWADDVKEHEMDVVRKRYRYA
jgi:glycerol-3-phosphate dehydrogenase